MNKEETEIARAADRARYVESLASEVYWAAEMWFRRIDPYHGMSPRWFALREDLKEPYRRIAEQLHQSDISRSESR